MRNIYVVLVAFLLVSIFSFVPEQPWKKELDKNGVQVFLRECPGCELKEFKAQTHVLASIDKVMALLLDFRNYPKWVFNNKGTFQLESKSKDEFIYYTQINCPKPTLDRDLVVDFKIVDQTPKRILIKTTTLPKYVNEKPKIVRVKEFNGSWELIRLSDNETQVITQCYTTPGGSVPDWIINTFITTGPYKTMLNMREILTSKGIKK